MVDDLLHSYVKGLERRLDAERALADDLAADLARYEALLRKYGAPLDVLARYREARGR